MKHLLTIVLLLILSAGHGQLKFKTLRYEEDYSYLRNDTSTGWYKQTKFFPLSRNSQTYLSLGGDVRYQYFWIKNEKWGDEAADKDGYLFSRLLLHADLHAGSHFRIFSQLQSSMANGKVSTSPVDEDPLELHQAFAEAKYGIGVNNKLSVRLGRQELAYGSQRLVSVREGPNNRQSFDAAKASFISKKTQTDLFYSSYVRAKKGLFNDHANDIHFWGAYFTSTDVHILQHIDLYYLGLRKKKAVFEDGAGIERRHSIGARIFSKPRALRYDIEMLYQFGELDEKPIRAWTVSFNSGYQFQDAKLKPDLGFKTELISGDRRIDDNELQTFNPLFPRGGYFGLASLIGPSNLFDIHPSLSLLLSPRLQLNMDADIFWRFSKEDGIYGPNVAMIYKGNNNPYRKIGNQVAMDINYTPNPYVYFRFEFTWFDAGNFLKAAGSGRDILFGGITTQLKF